MGTKLFAHLENASKACFESSSGNSIVATPFLTIGGVDAFVDLVGEETIDNSRWLVRLNLQTAAQETTEPQAVLMLISMGADVRTLNTLHAKLYLLPIDNYFMIGSANLTWGGWKGNEEIVFCSNDEDLACGMKQLFDSWWTRSQVVTGKDCHELQQQAEERRATEVALTGLIELGAFVTIEGSTPDVQQTRTIKWEEVGVPKPDTDYIQSAPPTLRLWPGEVRRAFERGKARCREWVKAHAIKCSENFLPRPKFPNLDEKIAAENQNLENVVNGIGEDDWADHRRSLEKQVRTWLNDIGKEQRRHDKWVEQKVKSIMSGLPPEMDIKEGLSIRADMSIPHPDGIDLPKLFDAIQGEMDGQRIHRQLRFSNFS
ncbi:MAG: phospholipase D-like domain-containing protein [Armatimonadota bacterium]